MDKSRLGDPYEEWENEGGSVGHIQMVNFPEMTQAENKRYKDELKKRMEKKVPLGFVKEGN
jgi:protein required for attachment to host cells